jgi:hypothetical protein
MQASFIESIMPIVLNIMGLMALLIILGYMVYGEEEEE